MCLSNQRKICIGLAGGNYISHEPSHSFWQDWDGMICRHYGGPAEGTSPFVGLGSSIGMGFFDGHGEQRSFPVSTNDHLANPGYNNHIPIEASW